MNFLLMVIICLMLTHLGCTYIPHTFSVIFLSGGLCPTGTCPGKFEQEAFVQGGFCPRGAFVQEGLSQGSICLRGEVVLGEHLSQGSFCPRGAFVQEVFSMFFSSPGPKVHGNYCHHLASVVCKLFTFQASSPKPLGQLEPNLCFSFQSDIQHGCQGQ